jgi:hypothetical protein
MDIIAQLIGALLWAIAQFFGMIFDTLIIGLIGWKAFVIISIFGAIASGIYYLSTRHTAR